jgi:hypothetical protein
MLAVRARRARDGPRRGGRPETWAEVCGEAEGGAEAARRLDAYAAALDEVEGRLLEEIAARSPHFFEAAGVVQDLRSVLGRTFGRVAGLRGQVGPRFWADDYLITRCWLPCADGRARSLGQRARAEGGGRACTATRRRAVLPPAQMPPASWCLTWRGASRCNRQPGRFAGMLNTLGTLPTRPR